ncbi:MAG: hypothetical protein ACOX2K_00860 [Bacillota bacterium]|jgi:hypothetical protein
MAFINDDSYLSRCLCERNIMTFASGERWRAGITPAFQRISLLEQGKIACENSNEEACDLPELNRPQLTSKELSMIEDQLAHEQLAIAKLKAYAAEANDAEVQRLCEAGVRMHEDHYQTLLKHLSGVEK